MSLAPEVEGNEFPLGPIVDSEKSMDGQKEDKRKIGGTETLLPSGCVRDSY